MGGGADNEPVGEGERGGGEGLVEQRERRRGLARDGERVAAHEQAAGGGVVGAGPHRTALARFRGIGVKSESP